MNGSGHPGQPPRGGSGTSPAQRRWRNVPSRAVDGLALLAATAGPLAVYAATLPRGTVLEDDGLFLMAGEHLGIAHPPGYPVYTVILHLFMKLPFGNPALLGHLSSAVFGALACSAVFLCARLLRAETLPALAAAWLFDASEHVSSQAIITEVYALNALLFAPARALTERLAGAKRELRLSRELDRLDRFECLLLDDIGYVRQDRAEMEALSPLPLSPQPDKDADGRDGSADHHMKPAEAGFLGRRDNVQPGCRAWLSLGQ